MPEKKIDSVMPLAIAWIQYLPRLLEVVVDSYSADRLVEDTHRLARLQGIHPTSQRYLDQAKIG